MHLVSEKLGACAKHIWQHALQEALKALPVRRRNAVPCLGRPIVQVIHTGQVHVLSVPAQQGMHIIKLTR